MSTSKCVVLVYFSLYNDEADLTIVCETYKEAFETAYSIIESQDISWHARVYVKSSSNAVWRVLFRNKFFWAALPNPLKA